MDIVLSNKEDGMKRFADISEMTEFAKEREDKEIIARFYANEAEVKPSYASAPMLKDQMREALNIKAEDVSDDTILNYMEEKPLIYLKAPINSGYHTFPIAELGGYGTMVARAGFSATDTALALRDRQGRKRLTSQSEADVLNIGLSASERKCIAVIRDERIYAVHSGEKGDYIYLPLTKLLRKANDVLSKIGEFISGVITHETSEFTYHVTDQGIIQQINNLTAKYGRKKQYDAYVRVITSDIAACGINIYPIIKVKGSNTEICFGRPIKDGHMGYGELADEDARVGALLKAVTENLERVFASVSDFEKALDAAEKVKLQYPTEAFCNMAKNAGISAKATLPYLEELKNNYTNPSAADAFWLLYDAAEFYLRDTKKSGLQKMSLYETINRMALADIKRFDIPEKMAKVW